MSEQAFHQQACSSRTSWYSHIEAWTQSGKTQGAFCDEHSLSYTSFGYWRTQYLKEQRRSQMLIGNKTSSRLTSSKPQAPRFVAMVPALEKLTPTIAATVQAKLGDLSLALPLSMPVMDMALLLRELGGYHAN